MNLSFLDIAEAY